MANKLKIRKHISGDEGYEPSYIDIVSKDFDLIIYNDGSGSLEIRYGGDGFYSEHGRLPDHIKDAKREFKEAQKKAKIMKSVLRQLSKFKNYKTLFKNTKIKEV